MQAEYEATLPAPDPTPADRAWWAVESEPKPFRFDEWADALGAEREAEDALTRGLCPLSFLGHMA